MVQMTLFMLFTLGLQANNINIFFLLMHVR